MNQKNKNLRETRLRGNAAFPFELYEMRTALTPIFVDYHWQEDMEILRVESGAVELLLDGKEYCLHAEDIAFINPGQLHRLKGLTPDTAYYAYVFPLEALLFEQEDSAQLKLLRPLINGSAGFPTIPTDAGFSKNRMPTDTGFSQGMMPTDTDFSQEILHKIDAVISLNKCRPLGYELLTKAYLLEIIALFGGKGCFVECHPPKLSDICKEILLYIQNNYAEKISVRDISKAVGLSENYFSCFFSKHFKRSFANYLTEYRVNRSCILLETTDLPITEIALECGFSTSSYYIQKFREIKKMTPYQFKLKNEA